MTRRAPWAEESWDSFGLYADVVSRRTEDGATCATEQWGFRQQLLLSCWFIQKKTGKLINHPKKSIRMPYNQPKNLHHKSPCAYHVFPPR